MDRIVKGIWIPIEIWEDENLSWNEKILLMEIDSFTSKNKDCFISNEYISELLGTTLKSASRVLSSLIKKGYVEKTKFDGRQRYVRSRLHTCGDADSSQMGMQTPHECRYTNSIDITNTSTDNTIHKGKTHRFVKPTLEEVRNYCKERGNAIDPEDFINHYESNGWMVGKNPMKDWKAAIRTWEKRNAQYQTRTRPESVYEHNMRVIQNLTH